MNREFLGWDEMPIGRAAAWLGERFGPDMEGVLVALPGARSGRILGESLARGMGPSLRPPRVVTAGLASDALLAVDGTPAGRLVRTLAWKEALVGLDSETRSRIVARSPGPDDLAGWMRLAEEVRGLFGEVAAEGLEFADVASNEKLSTLDGEQRRWQALAAAQSSMVERIEEAGFVDPHLGRLRAIAAGATRPVREVVLIGVSEMNALLRRALDLCDAPVHALVFAPPERAEAFDSYGALDPEAWEGFETSLEAESQWFVVEGPADQAQQAARVIAGWNGSYAAEDISIGLADREVGPHLQATLLERGVRARDAAGTPMARTRPVLLLDAVGRFADGRRFADLARLVRHPDFEAALRSIDATLEPVEWLDRYHDAHLPLRVDGSWLADPGDRRDEKLARSLGRMWGVVRDLLGPLLDDAGVAVGNVIPQLRQVLQLVYGRLELDPGVEDDRILIAGLRRLGDALGEIEDLPESLAPAAGPAATISLVLRALSNDEVPPQPARAGEPTIEMLGWLELALDDAPALVVTGFEDGRVPESVRGDAFLPNKLRQSLGLVDNRGRLARDLYATELMLRSRERVAFVSGRRSASGDPQLPSRIAFHCAESDVVPRVKRFLQGSRPARIRVQFSPAEKRVLPRLDSDPVVESLSVSQFRDYLESPYLFYLRRIARLESLDDRARELDPLKFGSLAHDVLQRFGQDAQTRDERDGERIARWLDELLRSLAAERYGSRPLAAVQLQVEQLARRLRVFAEKQAERRAQGWEIRASEWSPAEGSVQLPVDGVPIRLKGRIDRIDHHPERDEWAIWDYKTGEHVKSPIIQHRRQDKTWRDLQLPLYCLLAVELLGDAEPSEVGFIALPRDETKIGFDGVARWCKGDDETFADGLQSAIETAQDVVRRIRQREFFSDAGFAPRDPILAAIGGVGVIDGGGEE